MTLQPDHEALVLRAARAIENDIARDKFFRDCHSLLRPREHAGITDHDVAYAIAESWRRLGAS